MPEDDRLLGKDLAESPLASVLVNALKLKVTGELALHHDHGEDRIYFQGGIPTGTQVFHNFKPLGRMLLEQGQITMQQLEESLELMKKGQRQGEALVAMGALSHKQVADALRLLQVRNLVEMAKLPQARLEFDGLKPPPPWIAGVPVNALRTLRQVLAVPASLAVCQSLLEKAGADGAPVLVPPHLFKTIDHFELDADESAAMALLTQPITLSDFFQRAELPVSRASALVAELVVTGLLQPASTEATRVSGGAAPRVSGAPRTDGARAPSGGISSGISDEARDRRRRLLQKGISNMGGYARGRAAAVPHSAPPSTRAPAPPAAAPPPAGMDASIFDDLPEAADEAPQSVAPAPPVATAPVSPPPSSDDDEKLKRLIDERAKLAASPDLFARLGLRSGATKDQVKQAFVESAQLFHPDHLPASLASLAPMQREIFSAIKDAYDTLVDDQKRKAYMARGVEPKAAAVDPRQEQAKIAAFQGDQALRKHDYATAVDLFHQAYELYPFGDYLASEAWALFSDPARSNKKAREMIETALEQYPESERALYYVGMVARIDGKMDVAERMFKKVLRMNPRHNEASQEIHLIKLRKRKR
jgi:curved DNA-binding protein CbpA